MAADQLRGLQGKSYEVLEGISQEDDVLVFRGGRKYDHEKGGIVESPITEEVRERNALGFELGEGEFDMMRSGLMAALNNGALDRVSARERRRIRDAVIAFERLPSKNGWGRMRPPLFTAVDDIRTATTVFDGGSFYEGMLCLPGKNVHVRVKKYGDPKKFRRGIPVQRFLKRLEEEGIITQRINSPAYIDEVHGLVAELQLEGRRLTDLLRDARDDNVRAEILAPVIRDYIEMSARATEMRDMKIDEDHARVIGSLQHGAPRIPDRNRPSVMNLIVIDSF